METICIIGKPNVGKSTIFNRLIKERKSIILDAPGITRDRLYGTVYYQEKAFHLIDTGGILLGNDEINNDILAQASLAIDEADQILFIVDVMNGPDATDFYIRDLLRKANKKVIVVVNKIDNDKRQEKIFDYYELGFAKVIGVSAEHNLGFDELLKEITKDFFDVIPQESEILKFCFVGRPNVGKSSLVNALLNEKRVIVHDLGGTTRDAIDTKFKYNNQEYIMIDTAGMRKKGRIYENIEKYSLLRSMQAIERSNVCVLVISAIDGVVEHDKHILSYALDAGKAVVIAVNKWDTVEDPNTALKKWQMELKEHFKFASYIQYVYLSAKTKKRLATLMPEVIKAYENSQKEIKTSILNKIIEEAYFLHPAPSYKGKRLKIYFVNQAGIKPPKFIFEVNNKNLIHFSYERYLENKIRENIDFEGTPIIFKFKNKNEG